MTSLGRCVDPEAALPADASKLQVVEYSLGAVASLPRRLINPPPSQPKLELQDVLDGRHCAPISLTDFENYLTYTEHSVENLYFILWFQAYQAEHDRIALLDSSAIARVSDSVAAAARTYLEPNAPYEINLTEQKRNEILALTTLPPPPPSAYESVLKDVHLSLEGSLRRWEKHAMYNAGWRRLAFSTYSGLSLSILTAIGMVITRVYLPGSKGRIIAACLTLWLWFSIVGITCGLKGVCFLCYSLGGTVRQVSSFELALPRTRSSIHNADKGDQSASTASFDHSAFPQNSQSDKQDDPFSPSSGRGPEIVVRPTRNLKRRRTVTAAESKAMIVKLLAPMVAVEDSLVIRAHWEAVVYGFLWSAVAAVPIGVVAAAV